MNIFPKVGVDNIKLGMNQKEVQAILGAPANIEKIEEEEEELEEEEEVVEDRRLRNEEQVQHE